MLSCLVLVLITCVCLTCLCSLTGYSRLVMYSFGFQQAFRRGFQPEDQLFLEKASPALPPLTLISIPAFRFAPRDR